MDLSTDPNSFTDVAEGTYYTDAVKWAVKNGITSGTSATTFSPNASYTIESFVVESNTTMTFTTDRYFLNYSDGRTQFTMATQDSRMPLNKGTEK